MDLELAGKVAIVTGAGRGIGLAAAARLIAEGAHVVGVSPTAPARELHGIDHPQVRMTEAALQHLLAGEHGVIVNVSSRNARVPVRGVPDYSAAKAALTNYSKGLAQQFARQGLRVVTVSPGPVASPAWLEADGRSRPRTLLGEPQAEPRARKRGLVSDGARVSGLGGAASRQHRRRGGSLPGAGQPARPDPYANAWSRVTWAAVAAVRGDRVEARRRYDDATKGLRELNNELDPDDQAELDWLRERVTALEV